MEKNRPQKILVIEDEAPVRSSIKDIFEMSGYKVFTAAEGESGVNLALEIIPDLIICDVNMPGKTGFEVAEELNVANDDMAIPFIFLTARTDISDLRRGMSLGADEYIFKPFRAKELLAIVELRLERIKKFRNEYSPNDNHEETNLGINDRIMLEYKGKTELINIRDILSIEAESEYSYAYVLNKKPILVRRLLKDWEKMLPNENFVRIHRSTIINLERVTKIEKGFKKNLLLKIEGMEKIVTVSQRYSSVLKNKFKI